LPSAVVEGTPGERLDAWSRRWCRVPRGIGAGGPLEIHPFQREVVDALEAPGVQVAAWVAGRGNAKSTTSAVIGLEHIVEGPHGASVAIVSVDERSATRLLRTATALVEASPSLRKRVTPYADRLVCARTGGELVIVPAEKKRVEGLDLSRLIADEIGWQEHDVWESALLSLKAPGARALAVGTPSTAQWRDRSPLWGLVQAGRRGDDPTLSLVEHTSDPAHDLECRCCWQAANPGLGLVLPLEQLEASRRKVRPSEFARARLGRWVEADSGDEFVPPGSWEACAQPGEVPDGAEVVLGLDGSFSQDCTALVVCSISPRPHVGVVGLWQAPDADPEWRVPILDVEAAVVAACKRWKVREVCADPFRWQRSLEVLAAQSIPVAEFPQSQARMSPATTALREAVINVQVTHSGDAVLAEHVGNARLRDDARGVRITKASRHSRRRIDLGVAAVMAHARASFYAHAAPRRRSRMVVLR
jgi:phage terminase large subunit-like protein